MPMAKLLANEVLLILFSTSNFIRVITIIHVGFLGFCRLEFLKYEKNPKCS